MILSVLTLSLFSSLPFFVAFQIKHMMAALFKRPFNDECDIKILFQGFGRGTVNIFSGVFLFALTEYNVQFCILLDSFYICLYKRMSHDARPCPCVLRAISLGK